MQISKSSAHPSSESESEEVVRFNKSRQELRELSSQLHYAADYWEKSFFNSAEKKIVIEGTKEYLCRAAVAVVDHLGHFSTNLNSCISKTNAFSEAEFRINCLDQRLFSCEQYAHKLALTRVRWNTSLPKLPRRYLSTPRFKIWPPPELTRYETSNGDVRDSNSPAPAKIFNQRGFDAGDLPLFLRTCTPESPSTKMKSSDISKRKGDSSNALVPVCESFWMPSKGPNPNFHFQKHGHRTVVRKSAYSNDIFSLIRRTKITSK